jgi:hypothetical protein
MLRHAKSAPSGHNPSIQAAMEEVHKNVPKNVIATGKTGAAKQKMLAAVAYSKAGEK